MRAYTTLSILAALAFVAGAIFFFIQDDDPTANIMLVLASVAFISIYYFFKWMYYVKNSATLNEVSFVLILPLAPPAQILLKYSLSVQLESLTTVTVDVLSNSIGLTVDSLDILSLPYYMITIFFILRTYLRYPFIRLTGYSKNGLPSTFIAIVLSAGLPIIYAVIGLLTSNALLLLFAIIYVIVGLIGLVV